MKHLTTWYKSLLISSAADQQTDTLPASAAWLHTNVPKQFDMINKYFSSIIRSAKKTALQQVTVHANQNIRILRETWRVDHVRRSIKPVDREEHLLYQRDPATTSSAANTRLTPRWPPSELTGTDRIWKPVRTLKGHIVVFLRRSGFLNVW